MEDFHKFDGIPKLVELRTKDHAEAARVMKYGRINDGDSVADSLQRVRHTIQDTRQNSQREGTSWA